MIIIFIFVSVFYLMNLSECVTDLGELDCTATLDGCPWNDTCKGVCKDTCTRNEINIWGTINYPYYSPICKSAAHDLRISVWNTTERDVLLKRTNNHTVFYGSTRQRITSRSEDFFGAQVSSYEFLNDYISENILDITSFHSNYLFGENENHIQECFVVSKRLYLKFNTYYGKNYGIQIADKAKFGEFKRIKVIWSGRSSELVENEKKLNAGFQCFPVNNTLSILTSLAFRKDAYFLPTNFTVTVNQNETVTLNMLEQEMHPEYDTIWKKDGKKLKCIAPQNISRTSITLKNAEIGFSGIYSLKYKDSNFQRPGYIRLIVRACPDKKYGNFCVKECPYCLNGGICHDITGSCICAPGFSGSTCEKACEVGSVGRDCSMRCNLNSLSDDQSCKGLLICLPDPYGCSCAPGYFGAFCNETCLPGTYGAGCSQHRDCHCANGENCDIFSGDCKGNCSSGWHGKFCNEKPLNVSNLSYSAISSAVNLTWDCPTGSFSPVQYYIVTYKQIGRKIECSIPINDTVFEKNVTKPYMLLKELEPFSIYSMNVTAFTVITGWTSEITVETPATAPPQPSIFYVSYKTTTALVLTWFTRFSSHGLLKYFEVAYRKVESNDTTTIIIRNTKTSCGSRYDSQCCIIKNLKENQEYEIQLKAFNVNVSESSEPLTVLVRTSNSIAMSDVGITILERRNQEVSLHIFRNSKNIDETSYFVVVDSSNKNYSTSDFYKPIYWRSNCSVISSDTYVAGILHDIPDIGINFTIGNKSCLEGYFNPPLQHKKTYKFGLVPLITQCKEQMYGSIVYTPKIAIVGATALLKSANKMSITLGFLLPLAVIIGIGILFIYFQKSKHLDTYAMKKRFFPAKAESEFAACNEALDEFDVIETESICEDLTNCLPVKELHEFVKLNVKNNKIKREFMNLPKGQMYPCFAAKMPENKCKNRYGNILPYDHSRVVLKIDGESQYIHANYIDGYTKAKKYIATQGPLPFTMNDFWSMVWQEKVSKIIMITNLVENGKCKCEKYWTEDVNSYGCMELSHKSSESYADFLIRTFNLSKSNENREIKHFHFTSWPDHGVPLNTTPFLNFLNKAQVNSNCDEPIIVHCSAGIGRTGAVILFENSFDMGSQIGQVDILGLLCSMRKQRMNIVENYDQYSFVYHALVEALCTEKNSLCSSNFIEEYTKLQIPNEETGITTIAKQFKMLVDLATPSLHGDILAAYMVSNQSKNRSMHILPTERARPILKIHSNDSDYINAVYVDSYTSKNSFIATQYPLPETVLDFWRMVFEVKSKVIVILQDISFCELKNPQFWPLQGFQTTEMFHIEYESVDDESNALVYNLRIKHQDTKEEFPLRLVQLKGWSVDENLPANTSALVSLIKLLQLWEKDSTNDVIISICLDGVVACGVFCAFLYIVDRMKTEKEVDIFQTTKCIRTNRPQFIANEEQYKFLFDLTRAYLKHTL